LTSEAASAKKAAGQNREMVLDDWDLLELFANGPQMYCPIQFCAVCCATYLRAPEMLEGIFTCWTRVVALHAFLFLVISIV
jgi:hypothetical protein